MKKIVTLAMAALVATAALTGCKKGANDPFLSLKSRKARLKGEWKLVKVEGKEVDTDGTVTTISYDGTLWTETVNGNSGSYSYEEIITFDKKGTFKAETKSTYNVNFDHTIVEGQWAFVGKNKDAGIKNKEVIIFSNLKSVSSGQYENWLDGSIVTYNNTETEDGDFAYRVSDGWTLDKLSSKEIVVTTNYSFTDETGKSTQEYTYTYEKQ